MTDEQRDAEIDEIEEEVAEIDARDPDAAEEIADLVEDADPGAGAPPPDV